jgi:membrane-associated phospholipid phosphatase
MTNRPGIAEGKKHMYSTTNQKGMQEPTAEITAGGEKRRDARNGHRVEAIFWIIGLIVLVIACFIFHAHPQPFPIDIAVTQALTQLQDVHWANTILQIPSFVNDTYTSIIMLSALFIGMLLTGEVRRRRGKSAVLWFQSAIFLAVIVPLATGINILIATLVNRPRPSSLTAPIRHHTQLIQIPSFPSGHTEHAVVFWGFLLYLSFSKPVREWRYRWLLIPLQLYAVFDMLAIGVSRIVAEDHWITDILGGYLVGVLELYIFIMLFRWTTDRLARRRAKKQAEKSSLATAVGEHVD